MFVFLNVPQAFECLLSKNLIWIIPSSCLYWILHQQFILQGISKKSIKEHSLSKLEIFIPRIWKWLYFNPSLCFLQPIAGADLSRIPSGNSKRFLGRWKSYSFSDIQSRVSYGLARAHHLFLTLFQPVLVSGVVVLKTNFFQE